MIYLYNVTITSFFFFFFFFFGGGGGAGLLGKEASTPLNHLERTLQMKYLAPWFQTSAVKFLFVTYASDYNLKGLDRNRYITVIYLQ